jgi:hypothetical protein
MALILADGKGVTTGPRGYRPILASGYSVRVTNRGTLSFIMLSAGLAGVAVTTVVSAGLRGWLGTCETEEFVP